MLLSLRIELSTAVWSVAELTAQHSRVQYAFKYQCVFAMICIYSRLFNINHVGGFCEVTGY